LRKRRFLVDRLFDPLDLDEIHASINHDVSLRKLFDQLSFPDGLLESDEYRAGDDAVADVVLDNLVEMGQPLDVSISEPVSGIDPKVQLVAI
jgi:hypothetical protein